MIAVIQRVSEAKVSIEGKLKAEICDGFLILLGVAKDDTAEDIAWLAKKIVEMRVFGDLDGKMNKSIKETKGDILLISQFTLLAQTKKGNRPSFANAARPEVAIPLYESMIRELNMMLDKPIFTGVFGADMKVALINDGPVTIILDSKSRI
ncbi:MAG: D-aminoacyl-tRNA deacylase [Cytophagales bacterium]